MYNNNQQIRNQNNVSPLIIRNKISGNKTITSDFCPNCGNTKPLFYNFQSGMIVCFICRKASLSIEENPIQAY